MKMNNDTKNLMIFIGSMVLSACEFVAPILATCAFCLDWHPLLKSSLTMIVCSEFVMKTVTKYRENEV